MNSAVFSTFAIVALLSFGYIQSECVLNTAVAPTAAQTFTIKTSNTGTGVDQAAAAPTFATDNPVGTAPAACAFAAAPFIGVTNTVVAQIKTVVNTGVAPAALDITTFACNGQYATPILAALCYPVQATTTTAPAPEVLISAYYIGTATGKVLHYWYRFSATGTNYTAATPIPATGPVQALQTIAESTATTGFNQFCAQVTEMPTLTTNYTSAALNATTSVALVIQGLIAVTPTAPVSASVLMYDVTTGMYCQTFTAGVFATASSATQFTVSSTVSAMMVMLLAVLGN